MFAIDYYESESGRKPVEDFINSLDLKMRVKIFGRLQLLKEYGPKLGMPFSRHLDDGIFELRTVQGNGNARILYFFFAGGRIILTHGFTKKTTKTPRREIDKAKSYRCDWRARNG